MKKERKKIPVGQGQKEALSKGGQEACQKFTECRHSHGMSQKQWAEALGISYGLVKRIEARTIACSERTMLKVQKFMDACDTRPDAPDRHGLEEHILYDVFLTNMRQIPVKEASEYAGKCTRSLRAALSKASGCTSPDAQKRYFEFLDMLLGILGSAAGKSLEAIDRGQDMAAIGKKLALFMDREILKYADIPVPKAESENRQLNLFDSLP